MEFNDPLHEGKPNPGAFNIWIQLIEKTKHPFMILRRNADSIIPDKENGFTKLRVFTQPANFNFWLLLIAHKFGGVVHQVLHHFHQAGTVSIHNRKFRGNLDHDPAIR